MSLKTLLDLGGRKAIVTGGSRGLGLQIAEALGEMGAEVLISARKTDELDEALAHLGAMGIKARAVAADLGKPEAVPGFADEAIARLGHVDILVNNAGATWGAPGRGRIRSRPGRSCVNLNLTAVFLLSQQIGKASMIPRALRSDTERRVDRGARGQRARPDEDARVQHHQGRAGELHPHAGR